MIQRLKLKPQGFFYQFSQKKSYTITQIDFFLTEIKAVSCWTHKMNAIWDTLCTFSRFQEFFSGNTGSNFLIIFKKISLDFKMKSFEKWMCAIFLILCIQVHQRKVLKTWMIFLDKILFWCFQAKRNQSKWTQNEVFQVI